MKASGEAAHGEAVGGECDRAGDGVVVGGAVLAVQALREVVEVWRLAEARDARAVEAGTDGGEVPVDEVAGDAKGGDDAGDTTWDTAEGQGALAHGAILDGYYLS